MCRYTKPNPVVLADAVSNRCDYDTCMCDLNAVKCFAANTWQKANWRGYGVTEDPKCSGTTIKPSTEIFQLLLLLFLL